MTQTVIVPNGVEEWLAKTGPLHLLVGRLPDGWVDLTLTNATGRGEISAKVAHTWNEDGARRLVIEVLIPGERRLPTDDVWQHSEQLISGPEPTRVFALPRPRLNVAVNPVTYTLHLINDGTGLTGCGRRAAHGFVPWKRFGCDLDLLIDEDMCRKCAQWFRREYDL